MMKGAFFITLFGSLVFTLFCHMQKNSELATMKMELASLHQTYLLLEEENKRFEYQIEAIRDPSYLMEISKDPRFAHLNYVNKLEMAVVDRGANMDFSGIAVAYK